MRLAKSICFALACMAYISAPIFANAPDGFYTFRTLFWLAWGFAPMTVMVAAADYKFGIVQRSSEVQR